MSTGESTSTQAESSPEERGYIEGRAAALRHMMVHCARELGIFHLDDPHVALAYTVAELGCVRRHLRELSEALECNEWEDDLDLGDVVSKHVAPAVGGMMGELGRLAESPEQLPFFLIAMIEDDVEETRTFSTRQEVDAFEAGFGLAAGALGGPGWNLFVRYGNRWEVCDEERDKLHAAINQCMRRGIKVLT